MRKTNLCIGIFLAMVLVVSLSGGIAFGINPTESSQDQRITSSSDSFDSFLKYYQFGQENTCRITQATDKECLATGSKHENKILLALGNVLSDCVTGCARGRGGLACIIACTLEGPDGS